MTNEQKRDRGNNSIMKCLRFYIFPIIALLVLNASGQNLVPNGDFEIFEECPEDLLDPALAAGWLSFRGTPDYFNACNETGYTGIPSNAGGFQPTLSGQGYGGLIGISYNNGREILAIELSQPLEIGSDYYLEFYWSRAFGGAFHVNCNCASSHLGALLTTQAYDNVANPISYNNFAHVFNSEVLIDSTDWNLISGWVTADEEFTHIAIGNFFELDLNNIDFLTSNPEEISLNTYYYIENVCLSQDPAECNILTSGTYFHRNLTLEIFPNPTDGLINIKSEAAIEHITVFDTNGKEVLSAWGENTLDGGELSNGMYIVVVRTSQGVHRKKIIKTP